MYFDVAFWVGFECFVLIWVCFCDCFVGGLFDLLLICCCAFGLFTIWVFQLYNTDFDLIAYCLFVVFDWFWICFET